MRGLAAASLACVFAAQAEVVNFDDVAGGFPAGWTSTNTGSGSPKWTVERDDSAPSKPHVLKQSGKADFPLAVKNGAMTKDGFVEVNFKAVSGREDQAAGLVWRYRDAGNYYVARANALENNVVLYKVEDGKRRALDIVGRKGGYGVQTPVPANRWNTLRVQFNGIRHVVFLNGKELFAVENDLFTTAGKVGLWTKADSVTLFDNFAFGPP